MLNFNINVDASVYAKYYFELRSLAEKVGDAGGRRHEPNNHHHTSLQISLSLYILPQTQKSFPLEPLSTEQAKALEAHTEAAQRAVEKTNLRQAKSLDFKESKSPAILS